MATIRLGSLSQTHNERLHGMQSVLRKRQLRKQNDNAGNNLDQLSQNTSYRINRTVAVIDHLLKECKAKKDDEVIHNFERIVFGGTDSKRKTVQCTLDKSNGFTFHFCIALKDADLADSKLAIRCNARHNITLYLNDLQRASKYNNTAQSVSRKYHLHTIRHELQNKLFLCITTRDTQPLEVSLQVLFSTKLSMPTIMSRDDIRRDLRHKISIEKQRREHKLEHVESPDAKRVPIKRQQSVDAVADKVDTKKAAEGSTLDRNGIRRRLAMEKLDVTEVLQTGQRMLTTSRLRATSEECGESLSARSLPCKLQMLQSIGADVDNAESQMTKQKDGMSFFNHRSKSNQVPIISPAASIANANGTVDFRAQMKIEFMNSILK